VSQPDKLGVGVIGLGHNGLAFCDIYAGHKRTHLLAVCDRDPSRRDAAAQKYEAKGYAGYEMLEHPGLDIISIHTGDPHHAEPFISALEAGKHVFVEKPMANNLDDLRAMLAAADKSDRKIAVGHVLRFNPLFQAVKKMCQEGILGDIFYMEGDYIHDLRYQLSMERWKVEEEKPMVGGGCHPFDLLRWFSEAEPVEVTSYSNHIVYPEMREDATIVSIFKFGGGAVARVTALYGPTSPMPRYYNLALYGTKGTVLRDQLCLAGLRDFMQIPIETHGHPYGPEVDDLTTAIMENRPPLVTAREGARSACAVLCAHESSKTGRPVKIPHL